MKGGERVEKCLNELEKRIAALEKEVQKRQPIDVDQIVSLVSERITDELVNSIDRRCSAEVYGDIPE